MYLAKQSASVSASQQRNTSGFEHNPRQAKQVNPLTATLSRHRYSQRTSLRFAEHQQRTAVKQRQEQEELARKQAEAAAVTAGDSKVVGSAAVKAAVARAAASTAAGGAGGAGAGAAAGAAAATAAAVATEATSSEALDKE